MSSESARPEPAGSDRGDLRTSLKVRFVDEDGAPVAGAELSLVAISRGDGLARTERTDEQGALVLPRLTPGPWQVALSEREIVPESGPTQFGTRPAGAIPSNCCVLAGEVTRVDLWLEDREEEQGECRLTGRLTIDGEPAEGWVVALDQERATVRQGQAFLEPGLFRIGAGEPGSYRLRLSSGSQDPSTMLVLFDPVELLAGERYWSLELPTGALEGSMSAEDPAEALVFFRWQRGTVQAFVPLVPGADGRFRCARVPAGNGAIVRCDPSRPLEEQTPEVLRELVIEAGRTVSIEL